MQKIYIIIMIFFMNTCKLKVLSYSAPNTKSSSILNPRYLSSKTNKSRPSLGLQAKKDALFQLKKMMKQDAVDRSKKNIPHPVYGVTPRTYKKKSEESIDEPVDATKSKIVDDVTEFLQKSLKENDSYQIFIQYRKSPIRLLKCLKYLSSEKSFTQDMALIAIRTFKKMKTIDKIEDYNTKIIEMWLKSIDDKPFQLQDYYNMKYEHVDQVISNEEESSTSSFSQSNNDNDNIKKITSKAITNTNTTTTTNTAPTNSTYNLYDEKDIIEINILTGINSQIAYKLLKDLCREKRTDLAEVIAERCGLYIDKMPPVYNSTYDMYMHENEKILPLSRIASPNVHTTTSTTTEVSTPTSSSSSGPSIDSTTTTITTSSSKMITDTQKTYFNYLFLSELVLGHTYMNNFASAIKYMKIMKSYNMTIDEVTSTKILRLFLSGVEDMYTIRTCIRLLLQLNGLQTQESVRLITNKFLKHIDFVKGAVSMETLPELKNAEVAFIGRSNVGKSSLLNMVCNRKGLAYTSKTPGKTSEFNYFDANGEIGKHNDPYQFYLLDLPGVGFARVTKEKRNTWLPFFYNYVQQRETLRVLCHLVDSRHGFLDADEDCLDVLNFLPSYVVYVIVLTKVDKKGGGVKKEVIHNIRQTLTKKMSSTSTSATGDKSSFNPTLTRKIPIIVTSSEKKVGGSAIWSVLLDAFENERVDNIYMDIDIYGGNGGNDDGDGDGEEGSSNLSHEHMIAIDHDSYNDDDEDHNEDDDKDGDDSSN